MAAPAPFGTEFRVNRTITGNQDSASVAALPNGKFVVVWESDTAGNNDVKGQIYNADGSKFGGEMAIAGGPQDQQRPAVTGTGDGRFVVVWEDHSATFNEIIFGQTPIPDIVGRVFNADGTTPGSGTYASPFTANTDTNYDQTQPAIAAFTDNPANGRFLVSWTSLIGGDTDIYARSYNAASAFSPSTINVDASIADENQSAVAGLLNGNYVMAWTDEGYEPETDRGGSHIRAQIFTGTGVKLGDEFIVNSVIDGDQTDPAVAALSDGTFVVVWTTPVAGDLDIFSRRFQADGTPLSNDDYRVAHFDVNESQPSVTATATGYLVAWTDSGSANPTDGSGSHIHARLFNNDGSFASDEFIVNATVTAGSQSAPTVAALADGRFVVTWTDPGQDPAQGDSSGNSVRARIFDPRTAAVTLPGTAFGDDYVGTPFGDAINGAAGNDTLAGAGGNDTLGGGDGLDKLLGGNGADKLFGNADHDTLDGGAGNDRLDGGTGADLMRGGAGSDVYVVDNRGDVVAENIAGSNGADLVKSAISFRLSDTVHVKGSVEQLTLVGNGNLNGSGNGLNNVIAGNAGKNVLNGLAGNDQLAGGAAIDTLIGGVGNDKLNGGAGNDKLTGGVGNDRMTGGPGSDTFVFAGSFGKDIVADFTGADTISFTKALFANFTVMKSHASLDVHNDVVITVNANNRVTLDNVHKLSDLHAGDFIFV